MAAMAAILEIYFTLLLNRKANLSGNQVSDTGPSWFSCALEHAQNAQILLGVNGKSLFSLKNTKKKNTQNVLWSSGD